MKHSAVMETDLNEAEPCRAEPSRAPRYAARKECLKEKATSDIDEGIPSFNAGLY